MIFLEEKKAYHKFCFSPNPRLICHLGKYSRKEEVFLAYMTWGNTEDYFGIFPHVIFMLK